MKFFLALCFVFCSVASSLCLDREAFTITKYDLDVRLEPEQQRIGVRGTIVLRNDSSAPQKNAVLQLSSSLTWRSIQAAGKPLQFVAQPYESDIDHTGELSEAIVSLPQELAPGATAELAIGYEGVIALDAGRLIRIGMPKESALRSDWDQLSPSFSAVRGAGNVAWYPIATDSANLSEGNSLFETLGRWQQRETDADMEIRFAYARDTASHSSILRCSSSLQQRLKETNPGDDVLEECSFTPLGLHQPSFVLADYEILASPRIQIFYRRDHRASAEKYAQAADAAAPFVNGWLGPARDKVTIAELFDAGASPFENGSMLMTPLGNADPKFLQPALVHELTHAAFSSQRTWIYEGVAHFLQAVYSEAQVNRQAGLDFLGAHRDAIVTAEKAVVARPREEAGRDESLVATSVDEFYRSKAAYVWWMLYDMVGEDTLKKVLASYRAEEDKNPAYLQHLVEAQSKRDLEWFFDDWVYHDKGLPDFRVESAFPRKASQDNYLVTVTIENLGAAGGEVPVVLRFDGGELTQRVEVRAKAKGVLRFAIPKPPVEVVVNDGSVPESDFSNNRFTLEKSGE